jgi:hypothetical protein
VRDLTPVKKALSTPYAAPLRRLYHALVAGQLAAIAGVDRVRFRRREDPAVLGNQVTVVAKTFLRPRIATRMVRSLRRAFPGRIILADDSPVPMRPPDDRTDVIGMPFNSGVTRGRNAAIDRVRTPYVLVTDDDVVFTRGSGLSYAYHYLEAHPHVDAVCALLIEVPRWYYVPPTSVDAHLFPGHLPPLREFGEQIGGLPVVAQGSSTYLARTDALRTVRYDENIRMLDHRDFFSLACGRMVFVQATEFTAFHARTPLNAAYMAHRNDINKDRIYLGKKWG